jgi:sporulation integral membrane protein YlbJ
MYPLFHVSGPCAGAFLLGIVGGYPVGARTAIALYEKGQCSRTEAERLLSFCNNSGPAFILGVVGVGIFSSSKAGLLLYGAHVAASILVGLLFRFYGPLEPSHSAKLEATAPPSFPLAFTTAVQSAFQSTLNICGFVIFFTVLIRLLFAADIIPALAMVVAKLLSWLGLRQNFAESLLTGAIEMTSGVWSLRDMAAAMGEKLCMAAFILGWAGLSVHCQVLSFIGDSGLSTRTYFWGKFLHGIFSAVLIFFAARLFHLDAPVSEYLATQVSTLANLNFHQALAVSTVTSLVLWLLLTAASLKFILRTYGKNPKNRV